MVRLLRILRIAKALPRLRAIVEALISGVSTIGWIVVLIGMISFTCACVLITVFGQNVCPTSESSTFEHKVIWQNV